MVTQMFVTSGHDNVMRNVVLAIQIQQPKMVEVDCSVDVYDFEKVRKKEKN